LLQALNCPPVGVKLVMEVVCMLLNQKDTDWATAKKVSFGGKES